MVAGNADESPEGEENGDEQERCPRHADHERAPGVELWEEGCVDDDAAGPVAG